MNIAKQLILIIIGIFLVIGAGVGSYFLAGNFIKQPEVTPEETQTNNENVVTRKVVKDLTPEVVFNSTEDGVEINITVSQNTFAYVYITSSQSEDFLQTLQDYINKIAPTGKWFLENTTEPTNQHSFVLKNDELPKPEPGSQSVYMYILLKYNDTYIPYGQETNLDTGDLKPWILTLGV